MEEPRRSFPAGLPRRVWRLWARLVHVLSSALFGVLLIALGATFVNYVVLPTPKDRAYRNLSPD